MKALRAVALILAAALVLVSCQSLARGAVSGALSSLTGGSVGGPSFTGGTTQAAPLAIADFQSGEVLASSDSGAMMDCGYDVAKVLTPASAATRNQTEVVYIQDGRKAWANYVVNSRKAASSDFVVGATLFFLPGWDGYDEISADSYRKDGWQLGTVTSVQDLFKNRVEIDGNSFNINYVRVPTDPIK